MGPSRFRTFLSMSRISVATSSFFRATRFFGPTGIGVVYAREELQEIMPPWQGGGNMIRNVTFEETSYAEPPAKFEAGTPNIADTVGLGAALDYVQRLGLPNIGKYGHELLEYATERLKPINGVRVIGQAREKVSVISFVMKDRRTEDIGKLLDLEGIAVRSGHHCSQPSLASIWRPRDGPSLIRVLQHERRNRSPDRNAQANQRRHRDRFRLSPKQRSQQRSQGQPARTKKTKTKEDEDEAHRDKKRILANFKGFRRLMNPLQEIRQQLQRAPSSR